MFAVTHDSRHSVLGVWDFTKRHRYAFARKHTLCDAFKATSAAWSPDGSHLAAGSISVVRVWEVDTRTVVREIGDLNVTSLAWSPCGNLLFASTKRAVHVYNVSE